MKTIYYYRCEGCEVVHEESSSIFKCKICGTEICTNCATEDNECWDYCGDNTLTPKETIERFIKLNRYTYKVEHILEEYKNKWGKFYVSHTMAECCKSLEKEIKALIAEKDGEVDV